MSAVISAACALEAQINEFYDDAARGHRPSLGKAGDAADLIAELWPTIERAPVLDKYQWVLRVARVTPLDQEARAYQGAADLVELRHALVHFKPEWSDARRRDQKLEARLAGKFPLNPMAAPGQHFVPYRCLSAGCAGAGVAGRGAAAGAGADAAGV